MELNQLRYFVQICKTMNMSKAAALLGVSQSALSRSMARLEEELGFQLFIRDGPKLRMTKHGLVFFEHTDKSLEALDNAVQYAAHSAAYESQNLWVARSSVYVPPELYISFQSANADIALHETYSIENELAAELTGGRADLIFSSRCEPAAGVKWTRLCSFPLCVVCAEDDPLSQSASVSLDSLAGAKLACFDTLLTLIRLRQLFGKRPLPLRIALQTSDPALLLGCIRQNHCVALLPRGSISGEGVRCVPLSGGFFQELFVGVSAEDAALSEPARRFLEHIANYNYVNKENEQ